MDRDATRVGGRSSVYRMVLALICYLSVSLGVSVAMAQGAAPPEPGKDSTIGQEVTNPETGITTTVTTLI